MLRNYLKMALKVLQRRKFYTFISMFGICITLTILMVAYAFWDHSTGVHAPDVNMDRSLYISRAVVKYKNSGYSSGATSLHFLDRYASKLKTPESMSFFSIFQAANTYVNGKKVDLDLKYTDAAFWQIMQFNFIEGRPYTKDEFTNRTPVAVISKTEKEKIFGTSSAVGKEVKINQAKYTIVGVIENIPVSRIYSYGTFFLPYTLSNDNVKDAQFTGQYMGVLVASSKSGVEAIQQEFAVLNNAIENPEPDRITYIRVFADSYLESFARSALGSEEGSNVELLYIILGILTAMFMLLPTINLININVSRIQERASEIGVRKAFGASSTTLVMQFVVENLLLTLLCGVISVLLAYGALYCINASNLINYAHFTINGAVLTYGLIITILFGLLSGVYPAWRMSRLQPAEALKANT